MNDDGELRHGLQLWDTKVQSFLNRFVENGEKKQELLTNWSKFISGEFDLPLMRPYIASFICGPESAYHWASYGDRGKGVALDIDFRDVPMLTTSILADVIYDDTQKYQIIDHTITLVSAFMAKWQGSIDSKKLLDDGLVAIVTSMIIQSSRFKRASWAHENEWRIITPIDAKRGSDKIHGEIYFRNRGSDVVDFIKLDLKEVSGKMVGLRLGSATKKISTGSWKTLLRANDLAEELLVRSELDIG